MAKQSAPPRQGNKSVRWNDAWSKTVPDQQRQRMSRIRSKNTTPELIVRRIAHRLGYRFRLHRRDLPGRPDLVFPRLRKIVDVRGCFWHAHSCQRHKRRTVRTGYWRPKLRRNVVRDRRNLQRRRAMGWSVLVVWECEIAHETDLAERIESFLSDESGE